MGTLLRDSFSDKQTSALNIGLFKPLAALFGYPAELESLTGHTQGSRRQAACQLLRYSRASTLSICDICTVTTFIPAVELQHFLYMTYVFDNLTIVFVERKRGACMR